MPILERILESRRCVLHAYTIKSEPPGILGMIGMIGTIPRKWSTTVRSDLGLLAPGARMTVVKQTPSNYAVRCGAVQGPSWDINLLEGPSGVI